MEQRVNVITLGVADVGQAREFYGGLGWRAAWDRDDGGGRIGFLLAGGVVLALAEGEGRAGGGVRLTYVVDDPIDVEVVLAEARGGGATIREPACRTEEGGCRGVFVDPDGHAWEVLYDPGWGLVRGSGCAPCG